jgi:two-component system LytT family sensor kinase
MSLDYYIDQQVIQKNRGIYFKKGRWVMHVLIVLISWSINIADSLSNVKDLHANQMMVAFLPLLPFWLFFYYYCLYMVPYQFKQNKLRRFWKELITLIVTLPPIFFLVQLNTKNILPGIAEDFAKHGHLFNIGKAYVSFISSFVGFTAMLYFMELLEEVNTVAETDQHRKEHYAAALNKIKTQINPTFMSDSLNGIILLAEHQDQRAADAVIHFADILRYRLYKSQNKLVAIEQEITQLKNLFELQYSFPNQNSNCTLEIEGAIPDGRIVPLTLINLVESLLTFGKSAQDWSLLMYLLPEEKEIQVAIEINTLPSALLETQFEHIRKDLEQLTYNGINFTIEKETHNYSLRTCIPTFKNSIA